MKIRCACVGSLAMCVATATTLVSAQPANHAATMQYTVAYTLHGAEAKRHIAPMLSALQKEMAAGASAISVPALAQLMQQATQALSSDQSIYAYSMRAIRMGAQTPSSVVDPGPGSTQTFTTCTPMSGYALNTSMSQTYAGDDGASDWQTDETRTWRTTGCSTTS